MTSLSRLLYNFARAVCMTLAFVFIRVTRESFIKLMFILLGIMTLLQFTEFSLMRQSKGHLSQGLRQQAESYDVQGVSRFLISKRYPRTEISGYTVDQNTTSALPRDDSILSLVKSSSAGILITTGNRTSRMNYYSKQVLAERYEKPKESQFSRNSNHVTKVVPSVKENIYPRPRKHRVQKNKGRNILDLSANLKRKLKESNEVLLNDKIKTYKNNLTALLNEITLPATTPDYDIVNPGVSAEELGVFEHPEGKPLCPAVPPGLGK